MKYRFYILIIIAIVSCLGLLEQKAKKQKALFSKIKVGMKKKEVISILGKPDNIQIDSSSNKTEYFYYSLKSSIELHSESPYVMFDSIGIVKFSTYGDGN